MEIIFVVHWLAHGEYTFSASVADRYRQNHTSNTFSVNRHHIAPSPFILHGIADSTHLVIITMVSTIMEQFSDKMDFCSCASDKKFGNFQVILWYFTVFLQIMFHHHKGSATHLGDKAVSHLFRCHQLQQRPLLVFVWLIYYSFVAS